MASTRTTTGTNLDPVPRTASTTTTRPDEPPAVASAPPHSQAPERGRRPIPPVVWFIVLANLAVMGAYAVIMPAYRSTDEPWHFALVRLVEQTHSYPNYNSGPFDPHVVGSLPLVKFTSRSKHLTSRQAPPRSKRPAFDQITPAPRTGFNKEAQHPPLYYAVVAAGLREAQFMLPGDALHAWDQQVAAARLLSALLVAPIPLFVWLTARRMRLSTPAALTATLVPLAIPQLQHVGASVNNDDMLALLAAALTYLVVRIATGDTRTRTLVVAGVVTGLALFTKAFAYVFPFWVLAAVAVGRARQRRRISLRDCAIVLGAAFVSGGWWWARNFLKFGALSPSIDNARFPKAPASFHPDWVHWWHEAFRRVGLTFWGNFGWYDTHIPVNASVIAWAALGVALLVAFFAPRPTKRTSEPSPRGDVPTRAVVLLLLAPLILVGAEVFLTAGHAYGYSAQIPGLQGRYLFSAVAGLAVIVGVAVAALGRYLPRVARVFPILLLVAIVVMHTLSVRAIFGYYWGPATAGFTEQVRAFMAWCPWSPLWVWTATIVGVTSIVLMIVYVVRATFAGDEQLPRPPNGDGRGRISSARDAAIAPA